MINLRLVLFGEQENELLDYQKRFQQYDKKLDVYCYVSLELLKQNMKRCDVILMNEKTIRLVMEHMEKMKEERITFTSGKGVFTCCLHDIYCIEAERKQIHIRMKDQDVVMKIQISKVEELLESKGFLKPHRSYLVNAAHIQKVEKSIVYLENGAEIPLSKYRVAEFGKQYQAYLEKQD